MKRIIHHLTPKRMFALMAGAVQRGVEGAWGCWGLLFQSGCGGGRGGHSDAQELCSALKTEMMGAIMIEQEKQACQERDQLLGFSLAAHTALLPRRPPRRVPSPPGCPVGPLLGRADRALAFLYFTGRETSNLFINFPAGIGILIAKSNFIET